MKDILLILFSVLLAVSGQMLLKQGMLNVGRVTSLPTLPLTLLQAMANHFVLAGLTVFGFGAMSWLVVLSRVKLSFAYPMVSVGYVLTIFLSWLVFKENVPLVRIIGVFVICLGVFLVSRGGN